jgi:hypothetical protein
MYIVLDCCSYIQQRILYALYRMRMLTVKMQKGAAKAPNALLRLRYNTTAYSVISRFAAPSKSDASVLGRKRGSRRFPFQHCLKLARCYVLSRAL